MSQNLTTPPRRLWTIGHSTRSHQEFLLLLQSHNIQRLIDIRRYPGSRRSPHFHSAALAKSLPLAGIRYDDMPTLGGRRTARSDSPNDGWKNASFRGYADYMQTAEFDQALDELMAHGRRERTAIMCAEAVPWRCHRSLVADALVVRSWEVIHLLGVDQVKPHRLTTFALLRDGRLMYPAPPDQSSTLRMFETFRRSLCSARSCCRLSAMWYRIGADLVLLLHLAFVLFVIGGGLLLLNWPRLAWLHLPAVGWGVLVEFSGWVCPLTPIERRLRGMAGESLTDGDFIVRSLPPLLYPATLTREMQILLGLLVLVVNLVMYWWVFFRASGEKP